MPYLLEVQPYDPAIGGTRTLYFSDTGFVTEPGDAPANTYYRRFLDIPLAESRSLGTGTSIGGYSTPASGTITLANDNGQLDGLAAYSWEGRPYRLLWSTKAKPALADFTQLRAGVIDQVVVGNDCQIQTLDRSALFDVSALPYTFAGTGGVEGTADMKGRYKPRCLGQPPQFTPILVDAANLTYLIDPDGYSSVFDLRDGGKPLPSSKGDFATYAALIAADLTGYDYATCKALGLVRLRVATSSDFTLSCKGVAPGGTWISSFADLVKFLLTTSAGLTTADLDLARFAAFNTLQPAPLEYWADGGSQVTVRSIIDELADTVGAFWGFGLNNLMQLGRYDPPKTVADYSFTERQIVELTPQPAARRLRNIRLSYEHHYTRLTTATLIAAATPAADQPRLLADMLWTDPKTNASVAAACLLYYDADVQTHFVNKTDAEAERDRRSALYGNAAMPFTVTVPLTQGLDVGCTVRLTSPRYMLSGGRNFTVITVDGGGNDETMKLTVRG
ncbi:hypothetical protein [Nitrospirillum bahiense]|uniref:Tail protein n=1 Tax=Nitrospirillum amazonense TaxID=28077 RepID=A0A560F1V7_9PROT|nr:hypothetical protein [Nitrospirillum amazonense]TWB15591.1 hypothetical protein FBZ88_12944 [Nitrospirillum amazonense]